MYWDDDFAMEEYAETSWDIWLQLSEIVGLWTETYREHWGLGDYGQPEYLSESDWDACKRNDRLAEKLLKVALALNVFEVVRDPEGPPFKEEDVKALQSIFRDLGRGTQIRDRLSLDLAGEAVGQLQGATERCARLLGIFRAQKMGVRATLYIGRATRLYLWGFEPEAAIMCRAALEAALTERLYESLDPDKPRPPLDELMRIAGEHKVLGGFEKNGRSRKGWRARTNSQLWRAERVKASGNYVAHDHPALGADTRHLPDAFSVLREFSKVLADLFPPTEESGT